MPATAAKPFEAADSLFGFDNELKPQTPPIKDLWGYKYKMHLDEHSLALNSEYCSMVGGQGENKGLKKTLGA